VGSDGGEDIHSVLIVYWRWDLAMLCWYVFVWPSIVEERERWDPWGMAVVPGLGTGGVWQPLPVAAEAYESSTSSVGRDVGVSYYDGL
jgi:hypothetical protein